MALYLVKTVLISIRWTASVARAQTVIVDVYRYHTNPTALDTYKQLSGCWLCDLRDLPVFVSVFTWSMLILRGLPSVTSALAIARPADWPLAVYGSPPVGRRTNRLSTAARLPEMWHQTKWPGVQEVRATYRNRVPGLSDWVHLSCSCAYPPPPISGYRIRAARSPPARPALGRRDATPFVPSRRTDADDVGTCRSVAWSSMKWPRTPAKPGNS